MIAQGPRRSPPFFDRTLAFALSAAVLCWGSFPPLRLSFLVWIVPALWTCVIGRNDASCVDSRGDRLPSSATAFYFKIWLGGLCFWLANLSWLWQPPVWAKASWLALSCSLALFWVLFIGFSRVAVHGMRIPVIVAGPIVWCGLEWFRKNCLFGGFAYTALEHTQYRNVTIIQIADILGEYGVGMLIVFVGMCIGRLLPVPDERPLSQSPAVRAIDSKRFATTGCLVAFLLVVLYGRSRLSTQADVIEGPTDRGVKIALLQGNINSRVHRSSEMTRESFEQYRRLSRQAAPGVDLVVWPEAACTRRLIAISPGFIPENWKDESEDAIEAMLRDTLRSNHQRLTDLADEVQTPLILGVKTSIYAVGDEDGRPALRNSAVLVDPEIGVGPRYDKAKLIPFAEYDPLPPAVQVDYAHHSSFAAGESFRAFPVRRHRKATNNASDAEASDDPPRQPLPLWAAVHICYDGSFPHLVREQMRAMTGADEEPDVFINLTDIGLFGISSPIDMHLATHVFRAIETRKPYLVAANAGCSAWIDNRGRIIEQGQRGAATYVVAEVYRTQTESLYLILGDVLPMSCMCFNVLLAMWWGYRRLSFRQRLAPRLDGD